MFGVQGHYEQTVHGVLIVELASLDNSDVNNRQFDQSLISGDVMLDGTLDVQLLDPFRPGPADTFEIITAFGSLTGEFANAPAGQRFFAPDG